VTPQAPPLTSQKGPPEVFNANYDACPYDENDGSGVIIVQGRHVLHDAILCNTADCSIWLNQEDPDECLLQYLRQRGRWPHPDITAPSEVKLLLDRERWLGDYRLGSKFAHAISSTDVQ
jgi:hypothetical protein